MCSLRLALYPYPNPVQFILTHPSDLIPLWLDLPTCFPFLGSVLSQELSDTSGQNKRSAGLADLVTLGDSWLGPAVQRGLVQPLPSATTSRWYRLLPPQLRRLGHRNTAGQPDPNGPVYGAPYR